MQKNQDEFRTPPSPDPLAGWCACLSGQKLPRAVGQRRPSPRRAANLQERKHTCQLTTTETAAGDGPPQAPRRPTASTARGASPRQTREGRRPGRSGGWDLCCVDLPLPARAQWPSTAHRLCEAGTRPRAGSAREARRDHDGGDNQGRLHRRQLCPGGSEAT